MKWREEKEREAKIKRKDWKEDEKDEDISPRERVKKHRNGRREGIKRKKTWGKETEESKTIQDHKKIGKQRDRQTDRHR